MNPRFPLLSLVSLLSPFLVGFASYPIWLFILDNDPTGKAGMFIVIAAITCAILTACAGAIGGAILAYIAHRRRERYFLIRAFSFLCNIGLVGFGIYLWLSLPRA